MYCTKEIYFKYSNQRRKVALKKHSNKFNFSDQQDKGKKNKQTNKKEICNKIYSYSIVQPSFLHYI